MGSYEVENDDSMTPDFDDEVLCTGWIPELTLQQAQIQDVAPNATIPEDLITANADIFLRKMYTYQR